MGAHTNSIEGLWRHANLSCPAFNRKKDHFLGYLATFMLRKKWQYEPDSFACFMSTVAKLYGDGTIKPQNSEEFVTENEEYMDILTDATMLIAEPSEASETAEPKVTTKKGKKTTRRKLRRYETT